jgi:hypothetical protein
MDAIFLNTIPPMVLFYNVNNQLTFTNQQFKEQITYKKNINQSNAQPGHRLKISNLDILY